LKPNVVTQLVNLLGYSLVMIQMLALCTIGSTSIITVNEPQTQMALDCGALPRLLPLLKRLKELIRKETCWIQELQYEGTKLVGQFDTCREADRLLCCVRVCVNVDVDIYEKALWIVREYCDGEDENDEFNVEPTFGMQSDQFAFGVDNDQHAFNPSVSAACLLANDKDEEKNKSRARADRREELGQDHKRDTNGRNASPLHSDLNHNY
jgi:hypothetical protein